MPCCQLCCLAEWRLYLACHLQRHLLLQVLDELDKLGMEGVKTVDQQVQGVGTAEAEGVATGLGHSQPTISGPASVISLAVQRERDSES